MNFKRTPNKYLKTFQTQPELFNVDLALVCIQMESEKYVF